MLRRYVLILEFRCCFIARREYPCRTARKGNLCIPVELRQPCKDLIHRLNDRIRRDAELLEKRSQHSIFLFSQSLYDVSRSNLRVLLALCFSRSFLYSALQLKCKFVKVHIFTSRVLYMCFMHSGNIISGGEIVKLLCFQDSCLSASSRHLCQRF